ncbi:MAG: cystathionine gamma-synthase [Propionicimonas sp.]
MTEQSPQTRAVRAGINTDPAHGAVVPPIYVSTTYAFSAFDSPGTYDYSRAGNPTRSVLGEAISDLEGGAGGVVTASGMAAVTVPVLAMLPPGGTLLAPFDCYGGSWRLFDALERTGRLTLRLTDFSDERRALEEIGNGVDLVWLETPSNPLLRITDLAAVSAAAHAAGALVVADNTFATPVVQHPLSLGADIVVHSATKYLNGHSDVVAGAIVAADAERLNHLAWWANTLGVTGGALDSYLVLRGLRTLHLRMAAAQRNAEAVVELLVGHPAVQAVHFPGLAEHPQHELAARQQDGFGAIVTFDVGTAAAVRALVEGLEFFCLAESLGGVESLVSHPATMTHASMPAGIRAAAGITDGLLRLSLGVEDPADLVSDLRGGLDRALAAG